jgi:hypothetical protein
MRYLPLSVTSRPSLTITGTKYAFMSSPIMALRISVSLDFGGGGTPSSKATFRKILKPFVSGVDLRTGSDGSKVLEVGVDCGGDDLGVYMPGSSLVVLTTNPGAGLRITRLVREL